MSSSVVDPVRTGPPVFAFMPDAPAIWRGCRQNTIECAYGPSADGSGIHGHIYRYGVEAVYPCDIEDPTCPAHSDMDTYAFAFDEDAPPCPHREEIEDIESATMVSGTTALEVLEGLLAILRGEHPEIDPTFPEDEASVPLCAAIEAEIEGIRFFKKLDQQDGDTWTTETVRAP